MLHLRHILLVAAVVATVLAAPSPGRGSSGSSTSSITFSDTVRQPGRHQQPHRGLGNRGGSGNVQFGETSATSEQQTTGDGVQTNQGTATAVSVQQQTGLGGATQTTNNQGVIQALQQAQGGSGGGGQSSDNQVVINSSQLQQNVDGTLVNVQPGSQGIVIVNTQDPTGEIVGTQVQDNRPLGKTDESSVNCIAYCKRPDVSGHKAFYCCDDGTNRRGIDTPAIHPGFCPDVRIIANRGQFGPRLCSNDIQCGLSDKCCYDTVVQHHVCKTAQQF